MKKLHRNVTTIYSLVALAAVTLAVLWLLNDGAEPERIPEPDMETGRVVWKEAPPAAESEITIIFDDDGLPVATLTVLLPTTALTATPAATQTPTPTHSPTKAPSSGYFPGIPGTYLAEANGTHAFKPWTHYGAYTLKNAPQYRLQKISRDDENGLRIVTDPEGVDRFCIALGTAWAGGTPNDIGRCIDIYMQDGAVLHCVLADVKKVEDTQGGAGLYGKTNGDLLEFIVNQKTLTAAAKCSGSISTIGGTFAGEAIEVWVLDLYISGFGGST